MNPLQGAFETLSANFRGARLQGAKLEGVKLQGADFASAEIWLVRFYGLADQWPAPIGVADLKMSPLTPEAKAQLKQDLNASITDPDSVTDRDARLDEILRNEPPNWEDGNSWTDYVSKAKEPSADELARFHADLACGDIDGTIANRMAARAKEIEAERLGKGYAKPLASALLDENCKGGKALTR